jgi:hypothetical protein
MAVCMVVNNPQPAPLPTPEFMCPLCFCTEPIDSAFSAGSIEMLLDGTFDESNTCKHYYCFECTAAYAKTEIDKMNDADEPVIRCRHAECMVKFTRHNIQRLHELEGLDAQGKPIRLPDESFVKYTRIDGIFSANKVLPDFRSCPGGCGFGIVLPHPNHQFLRCEKNCKKTFCLHCLRHGLAAHLCDHDHTIKCEDHRLSHNHGGEAARRDQAFIRAVSKPCPGCARPIMKSPDVRGNGEVHTCMKMVHEGCRTWPQGATEDTLFCWCCLAPQRPILEHDNSFHKPECLYWTAVVGDPSDGIFQEKCSFCVLAGGTFCGRRPRSSCTRRQNGELDTFQSHFCACVHGCPCDSVMEIHGGCECGPSGGPTNACHCGKNLVTCGSCNKTRCRLCGRDPHVGYKCIEDRLEGDAAPPGELEQLLAAQADGEGDDDELVEVS